MAAQGAMTEARAASRRSDALVGSVLFAAVSWGVAFFHVVRNDGFDSGDLGGFAFWSILPLVALFPALARCARRLGNAHGAIAVPASAIAGLLFGFGWTLLVGLILGGWIGAFGFPVALCWSAGGTAAFVGAAVLRRPRLWMAGLLVAVLVPIGLRIGSDRAFQQPQDAVVFFAPGTTNDQVESVWNDVLSYETARGTQLHEGIRGLAAWGDGERRGIRIAFRRGAREATQNAVLARLDDVAFVDEVLRVDPPTREDIERRMRSFEDEVAP